MSQHNHKTDFDKKAYWERRNERKRGQGEAVETTKVATVPSQNRTLGSRSQRRKQWMNFRRQERKGSTRGE